MTHPEWLTSTDPGPMLDFLRGKVSDRRLFLFGIASIQLVWDRLSELCKDHVNLIERYAEGNATSEEERRIRESPAPGTSECYLGVYLTADAFRFAQHCMGITRVYGGWNALQSDDPAEFQRSASRMTGCQADLLRCIVRSPFYPWTINPTWLGRKDCTIARLGQAVYDEGAFDRLPLLADALEEAGCDDADLLAHCRQPGPHVRGCWVVDLILHKE